MLWNFSTDADIDIHTLLHKVRSKSQISTNIVYLVEHKQFNLLFWNLDYKLKFNSVTQVRFPKQKKLTTCSESHNFKIGSQNEAFQA